MVQRIKRFPLGQVPECLHCMHWDQSGSPESRREKERERDMDESGLCRRYPPVLDSVTGFITEDIVTESPLAFVQPLTWASDWCGEYVKLA